MNAMNNVSILDSTLRDGAQGEQISFSLQDKLNILQILDAFGVDYIEAGTPASNPKDLEFFSLASKISLKNTRLCAFGSTRRKGRTIDQDDYIQALLEANTPAVSIVGKASETHAHHVLQATLDENLAMIADTVRFFKLKGKQVIFDAEHFFDGFLESPDFALASISAALENGADIVCLCDTNGGRTPTEIISAVNKVRASFPSMRIGIHCHDDSGCAVANSMVAVEAGATHVQGTFL
ncbi:MAG: citramalate synthase, partial [Victivallales bacterium]|nr:citramalate synthase [Victivallales bacterium]